MFYRHRQKNTINYGGSSLQFYDEKWKNTEKDLLW